MLRSMPRRKQGLQLDVADAEGVAIVQEAHIDIAFGPFELPIRPAFRREIADHSVALHQLACSAEVIGVDVSVRHGGNAQIIFCGNLEVTVNVALGVDHDRLTGTLATDQVDVLGEGGVGDLSKKHGVWR